MDKCIDRKDLFKYSFYNNDGKVTTVLNVDKLKQILNTEVILLDELNYSYKE